MAAAGCSGCAWRWPARPPRPLAVVLGVTSLTAGDPKATEPPVIDPAAEHGCPRHRAARRPPRAVADTEPAATGSGRDGQRPGRPATSPVTPAASTRTAGRPRPRTPRPARPPAGPPRTTGPAPGPSDQPAPTAPTRPGAQLDGDTDHDADRDAHVDTDRQSDLDAHVDAHVDPHVDPHGAADPDPEGPGAPGAALLQRRARRAPRPRPPPPAALRPQGRPQGDDDPRRQALRAGLDLPLGGRPLARPASRSASPAGGTRSPGCAARPYADWDCHLATSRSATTPARRRRRSPPTTA